MGAYTGTRALNAKREGMRFALLLAILAAIAACLLSPTLARADDVVNNDEVVDAVPLTGSATVKDLPDGQIQITVSSTNDSGADVPGHLVEFEAPDGYELVSGSLKSAVQTTEAGGTLSTTAVFKKVSGKKNDGGGSGNKDADDKKTDDDSKNAAKKGALPRTGDTLAYVGVAIVCVCAGVLFIMAARKLHFKGMVLIVATVALVAASYPVPMLQAFADEATTGNNVEYEVEKDTAVNGDEENAACDTPVTGTKTLDLTAGDQEVSVNAKVTFLVAGDHDSATTVNVDTSNSIAKYATSAFLILESSEPFAVKESTSKKEGKEAIEELSDGDDADDYATASDFGYFDGSKLEFSGALEGVTLRGDPLVFKTTEKDEYAKNTLDDDDTTHYEMWLAVDDIPAKNDGSKANENYAKYVNSNSEEYNPYGYISFAQGSFDKSDDTDESSLGIACVKFVDADPTILQVTSKTEALGSDTDVYTYDNGEFYDGTNKFKVAIDLDGIYLGMPVRDDVDGFDALETEAYTIDGIEGHTFKQLNPDYALSKGMVSLLHKDGGANITATDLDWDDANLWVEFTVEGLTGQDAYEAFTEALSRGVRISPILASMSGTTYTVSAYPEDTDEASAAEGDGFAYAESNPTAVMWATGYTTSGETTEITYLAAVQGASELVSDEETVTDVNLKKKTEFTAAKQEVDDSSTDGSAASNDVNGLDLSSTSGMEIKSVGVNDTDNNVMELKVTVPTSEFTSSLEALGLSTKSDESEVLGSLYSYVSGLDVRMTNGSTNAFGVADVSKQVQLIDGASLMSDLASSDTSTASNGNSTTTTPKTAVKVKESVEKIADDIERIVNDDTLQKAVKQAIESGKEIFGAITKIIKAYKDSGGAALSMLGPVGSIIGAAVTFINVFDNDETETTYSINDVMNKLDKLEQTVNGVSTNTSVIALSLQEMENSSDYKAFATDLGKLHTYMSGKQMTSLISNLQEELGKIDTKDGSGKCSLATPLEDMPEDAITLVRTFVTYGNKYARLQAGKSSAEEALNELYTMIKGGFYHDVTLLDAYFKYTENFYNWESETYVARQAFIASISQMWLNACMVANADFALQAYDKKTATTLEQETIKDNADVMQEHTQDVMRALYGDYDWDKITDDYPRLVKDPEKQQTDYELDQIGAVGDHTDEYDAKVAEYQKEGSAKADAESKAIQYILDTYYFTESPKWDNGEIKDAAVKKTHSDGSGVERLLVVDSTTQADHIYFSPTYPENGTTKSYYAKTAAYDKSCFGDSYVKGDGDGSSGIIDLAANSTWSANSSFKAWQVTQMVKRLKALPTSLRPTITDTDSSGNKVQRAVENVDEELQSLGFKSINTSPEKNYKLKVAGMDRTTKGKYTIMQAFKRYGVVDTGTADNPTATADEVLLDSSADENQTWPYIMTASGYTTTLLSGGYKGALRTNYWVELGSSAERLLGGDIGDRIQHSGDWVITESGDVVKGARDCNSNWHSKSRYGTVVNYKDGTVKENQFLYTVDAEYYNSLTRWYQSTNWFTNWCMRLESHRWITRVEFYAFGVFNLTTKSAKIETGAGSGNVDGNLYRNREYLQEAYDNGSLQHDLYYPKRFARFDFENSYWWVRCDGKLYPVEEGIKNDTSKEDPWYHYEYAE